MQRYLTGGAIGSAFSSAAFIQKRRKILSSGAGGRGYTAEIVLAGSRSSTGDVCKFHPEPRASDKKKTFKKTKLKQKTASSAARVFAGSPPDVEDVEVCEHPRA